MSSTASLAPRSIERAIHGSVDTGALTTTGTASPPEAVRPPQPETRPSASTARSPNRSMSVIMAGIGARSASLAAVALAALVAGCGGGERAARECSPQINGEPERRPPADMPLPPGAHVYISEGPFGKTERFFAVDDGEPDELVSLRDEAADALAAAGFKLLRKDDEAPIEAEAHFTGTRTISVQVTSLCAGKLRLRYTVS
jgi:hypothetical protein